MVGHVVVWDVEVGVFALVLLFYFRTAGGV